jgi:hypothetical protein
MKRLLRIIVGSTLFPVPMFLVTWIWLFDDGKESWTKFVGKFIWELISGQWDKFLNDDEL